MGALFPRFQCILSLNLWANTSATHYSANHEKRKGQSLNCSKYFSLRDHPNILPPSTSIHALCLSSVSPKSLLSTQSSFSDSPYFLSQQFLKRYGLLLLQTAYKWSKELKWNKVREDIWENWHFNRELNKMSHNSLYNIIQYYISERLIFRVVEIASAKT